MDVKRVRILETVDVLWRNRPAEINRMKIEDCYFEQKPDRHRPFVGDERATEAV